MNGRNANRKGATGSPLNNAGKMMPKETKWERTRCEKMMFLARALIKKHEIGTSTKEFSKRERRGSYNQSEIDRDSGKGRSGRILVVVMREVVFDTCFRGALWVVFLFFGLPFGGHF